MKSRYRFVQRYRFGRAASPLHIERMPASGGASDDTVAAVIAECARARYEYNALMRNRYRAFCIADTLRKEDNVNCPPKRAYN